MVTYKITDIHANVNTSGFCLFVVVFCFVLFCLNSPEYTGDVYRTI